MRRRQLLSLIGLSATAGCIDGVGSGGAAASPTGTETQSPTATDSPTGTESPTATDSPTATETASPTDTDSPTPTEASTPTVAPTKITGESLKRTGDCSSSNSGTASVRFEPGVVVVEGCIQGPTGCSAAALKSARYDSDADRLVVTVETVEEGDVCTQQIVYRAYTVRVQYSGGVPGSVAVRHADDGGSEVVTTADS